MLSPAENHAYAVALHMMYYNFVVLHSKLRMSPAMAAGVSKRLWEIVDIVGLVEAEEDRAQAWTLQEAGREVVKILEDVIDGLSPLRHHGLTLYPADQLDRIFDWAVKQGKRIEWIDAIRLGSSGTQPSMEHSMTEDASIEYSQFRATCLETALSWIASSRACGMTAYFEIGISD